MERDAMIGAVHRYYRVLAEGGVEELRLLVSPTLRHNVAGIPESFEGWTRMLWSFRDAFPDLRHSVDDVVGEGSRCAVRITTSGTHVGNFLGHAPTGRRFRARGMEILAFEDGLVAERWGVFDVVAMLRQLGLYVEAGGAR